ncbi:MAG TPA: SGNH/GDSL hydrolase family protein [Acidimicrobiales bacterium]
MSEDEVLTDTPPDGSPVEAADGQRAGDDQGATPPQPRRRRIRRVALKLGIALLSVVLTLGAVEIVFRLLGYQPVYDVYSSPDEFFRHDPAIGWSLTPGAEGVFVGPRPFPIEYRTRIRVNSLGLRGPDLGRVPPEGLRVLVLGDSWVAGFEVDEDRTYTSRLERALTDRLGVPVQVINAGVRGYGTDQALLLYRERLRDLEPDLVIHHTTGNDPDDNTLLHRMRRVFSKPAFALGADDRVRLVGQPVDRYPRCSEYRLVDGDVRRMDGRRARSLCWLQTRLSDHSALFSFITERLQQNPELVEKLYDLGTPTDTGEAMEGDGAPPPLAADGEAAAPAPSGGRSATDGGAAGAGHAELAVAAPALDHPHRLTSVLVRQMAEDVRADGAGFVLIGQDGDLGALDLAAFDREMIQVVRIDEALEEPGEVLIPNDGHPNELGHERIAALLADALAPRLEEPQ